MSTLLRAAVALGLALLGLVLVAPTPAYACSCAQSTLKQSLKRADAVFVATVVDRTPEAGALVYRVHASSAYKGDVDYSADVRTAADSAACGLDNLEIDREYLFFAQGEAAEFSAGLCGGTRRATPAAIEKVENFAKATPVEVPPPPEATLTPADTSEPTGFARLAAPGAAVAVAGLLGLLLVGRLARR